MKRGVRQITDDVTDVKLREDGSIVHLVTKEHGNIEADLYIDCTGFRGLLINQALNEPFISFSDNLPNDRAVAIQVPTDPPKEGLAPYTMATALSAGWAWTIPLYNRNGCGYVYSGKYIDKDQAEAELRRFLGPRSDNSRAHHVQMRVGRCRNSWVQNCIAVGLSSGFVEPLESTGLFFIQYAIEEIVNHLPVEPRACENERLSYNRAINDSIDGIREFLIVHYRASDRTDTQYWRDTKTLKLTDALEERMKIWKARLPAPRNIFQPYHGFEAYSYSCILLGMNYEPEAYHPVLDVREEAKARAMFRTIREKSTRLVQSLPSQYEYLKHMRNGASTSASAIASLRRDLAREHSAV
jgi:tryptophan halogenase